MWWLDGDNLIQAAAGEQRARLDEDVWHTRIAEFIALREQVIIEQVIILQPERRELR